MKLEDIKHQAMVDHQGVNPTVSLLKTEFDWLVAQAEENKQVKKAYADRIEDIKSLEQTISKIKTAYEQDDENILDETLHDLFTNEVFENY